MGAKFFGAAVKRREDPRFLRGEGRFIDDVTLPGLLHAAFLRSPHAHARIARVDTTAAAAAPGVVRVHTFADLERWMKPLPLFGAVPPGLAAVVTFDMRQTPQWALCRDRARYVGEIVAMVVADCPERAEDSVDLIRVDWELLTPVVDMTRAAEPGAPLLHPEWGSNIGVGFTHSIGDADRAFAQADVTVTETFHIQRYVGMPLENRGVVATWDRRDGTMTTWNSTQVSHFVQQGLTGALGLPPHKIRVIAPDLGGGFGTKASGYAEDALVPIAAMALGRPVKWIESRREHMSGAAHARHQVHAISLAAARDGAILGVRDRIWLDLGAYNVWGVVLPYNTVAHLIGPHRIKHMRVDVQAVVTNKTRRTAAPAGPRPCSRWIGSWIAWRASSGWTRPSFGAVTISARTSSRTISACPIATATHSSTTRVISPRRSSRRSRPRTTRSSGQISRACGRRGSIAASASRGTSRARPSAPSRAPR